MRALTYSLCISSAAGFSAVASWYDAGTRLTNADIAEATGVVTPTDGVYPMLGVPPSYHIPSQIAFFA